MNKIIDRIIKKVQVPELMDILVRRLSLPDLQSLLLEVYRRRTNLLEPRYVLEQYIQNRFVQSAQVNPRDILEFDGLVDQDCHAGEGYYEGSCRTAQGALRGYTV